MTSISKNVYNNTLADMVYKCNNTYHTTIKMKPVDIKSNTYLDFNVENNDKEVVNGKEIVRKFYEKEFQKGNQTQFMIDKVVKKKGNKLYGKWKGYDNYFYSWIDGKISL